jgi:hypothetical protein
MAILTFSGRHAFVQRVGTIAEAKSAVIILDGYVTVSRVDFRLQTQSCHSRVRLDRNESLGSSARAAHAQHLPLPPIREMAMSGTVRAQHEPAPRFTRPAPLAES